MIKAGLFCSKLDYLMNINCMVLCIVMVEMQEDQISVSRFNCISQRDNRKRLL